MILKLKSFIQIGNSIFHMKFLTTHVPVNFLNEARYSTSIYHLDIPLWTYNTRKYSLGELILLAKSKEYTLLYIPDKFQGAWMTKFFRRSVFYRSLNKLLESSKSALAKSVLYCCCLMCRYRFRFIVRASGFVLYPSCYIPTTIK